MDHYVALTGTRDGWLEYEALLDQAGSIYAQPEIAEGDLLTINYTSGTTARPKGVMITHRNAYLNILGTLAHLHLTPVDSYLWTLPMFHANGWTFVWTVTAVGAQHVCVRRVEPQRIFDALEQERVTVLCAAPTVLVALANAADPTSGCDAARSAGADRRCTPGARHDRTSGDPARLGDHPCVRAHRDIAVCHLV